MTDPTRTATPLDVEVVEPEETALAPAGAAPALAPLAFQEDAVAIIERMGKTLQMLQDTLIRVTQPEDWIIQGNGLGLLGNPGCMRCAPMLGLTCEDDLTPVKSVDDDGATLYTIVGYVHSKTLGRGEEIEFTRSSIEPFLGRQTDGSAIVRKGGRPHDPDHRSATRSGFMSKAVRKLGGLSNVPEARLLEVFGPGAKNRFQRGHGAGSGQDRQAENVGQAGAGKAQEIWDNLLRLHAGDVTAAGQHLKQLTAYPAKAGSYDAFPGVDNLRQLSTRNERTLSIVDKKVKEALAKQEQAAGQDGQRDREPGEE